MAIPWRQKIIHYASPFSVWGIFTWFHLASDRWALRIFGSTVDVGQYAVLYQLGYYPMVLLSSIVSQLMEPILFQRAGDATDPVRKRATSRANRLVTWAALAFTITAVLAVAILHRRIFALFTASAYANVSQLLPLMVLSGGLFGAAQLATIETLSNLGSRDLLRPKVLTAILGVMLNICGAAVWGIGGVVLSWVIFGVIYITWVVWLNRSGGLAAMPGKWKPGNGERY